jgi:hypothetical protein
MNRQEAQAECDVANLHGEPWQVLPLIVEQVDPSGDRARIELDTRDGRAFLVVVASGHEALFELTPETATAIGEALCRWGAPVDLTAARFTGRKPKPVSRGNAAVSRGARSARVGGAR